MDCDDVSMSEPADDLDNAANDIDHSASPLHQTDDDLDPNSLSEDTDVKVMELLMPQVNHTHVVTIPLSEMNEHGEHQGVDEDGGDDSLPHTPDGEPLSLTLSEDSVPGSAFSLTDMGIGQALQIVNLPDGTQAMIQQAAFAQSAQGESEVKSVQLNTQAIQLPDGTTALLQNMPLKGCQAVKLEDGTVALVQTALADDNIQAVQLEDGTTAYITHMTAEHAAMMANMTAPAFTFQQQLGDGSTVEGADKEAAGISVSGAALSSDRAIALGDKAYQCRYAGCGRLYTTMHHLKVHERSHTGDRPFKCEFGGCDKAFATGYGLKTHHRTHTGEKPYKCPTEMCGKGFKTSGDLQKHIRTHTGERPFKCPFEGCTRAFTTSNIRKVHIRSHTGERPYTCSATGCGKSFSSATNYKNHIRIHTGEKPYICTVENCGRRFTEYSSLYKHHVVHTHSKPYVCNRCGKNYRQTSTLAMHKRTMHGEDSPMENVIRQAADIDRLGDIDEDEDDDLEPPDLHCVTQLTNQTSVHNEDDEGTLVINTTEAQQDLAAVAGDTAGLVTLHQDTSIHQLSQDAAAATIQQLSQDSETAIIHQLSQEQATATIQQLAQGKALTLTTAHPGSQRQILVVTDPAQLHILQQIAAQQQGYVLQQATEEDMMADTSVTAGDEIC